MERQSIVANFLAGGLSGFCEVTTSHPLDVVKTAMQDKAGHGQYGDNSKVRKGPFRYLIDRYKRGGIRHLYRGYVPRVFGILPMRATFWGVQHTAYTHLREVSMPENYRVLLAGVIGGTAQTVIDTPIEVMKTRMITTSHQNQVHAVPRPFLNPVRGLLAGFSPTLFRNIGFMVTLSAVTTSYETDSYLAKFILAGAGGFAGSVVTQPIDYVKTQMQSASYRGERAIVIFINALKENPRVLMTGTMPRGLLGFMNMGVGFCAFNIFKRIIE
jgi:Mitochondrial carrier protein